MEARFLRARDQTYRWHLNRAVALQDLENLGMRNICEAAVSEDGADGFAVRSGAALKGMDDRKSSLAFAKI